MVNGRITMSGTGAELLERKEVRAAYLEGDTAVLKETNGA
jgi:branched-chain amino acid transport system ATP-binding protein